MRPNLAPYRVRTVSVPFSVFFTVPFFTASATVTVPFFSLTVGSVKRTEPSILTVRILIFDREPYRTKVGIQIYTAYLYTVPILLRHREPYRTSFGAVRIAVRFAVLNNKRITVPTLVRYGSRSNTKMQTVKTNGSVRFALLTVRLKNGTDTIRTRYGHGTDKVRYRRIKASKHLISF